MTRGRSVIIYSVSRNGGTRTRTERHLKPTPLPNRATFRRAPGVTRDPRHKAMTRCRRPIRIVEPVSGWCRIRTCGTSRFTCFQDRRVRPLRQPSMPDFLSGRSGYGPHVHRFHMIHRRVESGGRADWILPPASRTTVPVVCTLWTCHAFGHQPGRFQPRTRLTPTVPKGVFGHSHDDGWVVTHPPSCPEPDSNRQHAD